MRPFNPYSFWDNIDSEASPAWPVICIDLNGVLDEYSGWNGRVAEHPVVEGAHEFLQELRKHFNTIVIFTATMPISFAENWLRKNGFEDEVDFCTNHKVPAQVYVDDRAVCHNGNFQETLHKVLTHNPHWRKVAVDR